MDIAKFEYLLSLPLKIKKASDCGSWRGIYTEPAIFFENAEEYIPISELRKILDELTSGKVFEGYKGGEFSYDCADEIHFEYGYSNCEDLSILELLSLDSIEHLRENKIDIR